MHILVSLSLLVLSSHSYVIDYSTTKVLTINDTSSYFGYSILLQRGNPPIAIVGAPKRKHSDQITGAVYKCDLNTAICSEYSNLVRTKGIHQSHKNGDFLGSVVDGDDVVGSKFFTCAPRNVTTVLNSEYYFLIGGCFYIKNSTNLKETGHPILPLKSISRIGNRNNEFYYDAGFAESGFDFEYLKDENSLLTGAPGRASWKGDVVKTVINNIWNYPLNLQPDLVTHQNSYYGYAVSWGKFVLNSKSIWYVAGAPRANNLKGNVVFFESSVASGKARTVNKRELIGEKFGSYFGSSLFVLHKNNGGDDILIGAPMYSENSWDEGCVYYYRNKNDGTFEKPIKLLGKSSSSRFGTVIADLGDIDLDTFHDCAISAPYEDDGVGAVYLYYGTARGFSTDNYHKISPYNFVTVHPNMNIKGFGMGVSKGVDLDSNKHNDIVIGAYQSGHAFYFKSHYIINIYGNITSSKKALDTTTESFILNYCLIYTHRNKGFSENSFITQILLLDERVANNKNITETVTIPSDKLTCKNHTVLLKKDYPKIDSLNIIYKYRRNKSFDRFKETFLNVPFLSGCGSDNICQTDLSINATFGKVTNLVVGLTLELQLNVTITNVGEPAYQTKLYLTVPSEVSLINLRECYLENGSYVCLISPILRTNVEKNFLLDTSNLQPNTKSLLINLKVESLGVNRNPTGSNWTANIPISLQSNPHIDSQSTPESVGVTTTKAVIEVNHFFLVSNQGPSPLNLDLIIFVPQINGSNILEIKSIEGTKSDMVTECTILDENVIDIGKINTNQPTNNSDVVNCFQAQLNCTQILCRGGYLPKSSDYFILSLNFLIHTDYLAMFYKSKDNLNIGTIAYLNNGTTEIHAISNTLVYGLSNNSYIPLWIYVLSAICGILLLIAIIFCLYKCNFFQRTYKEKLENEQDSTECICDDNNDVRTHTSTEK